MNTQERKELRASVLKKLYDKHFDPNHKNDLLKGPERKDSELSDHETFRAYWYLAQKELIIFNKSAHDYAVGITALGIDTVEESF